MLPACFAGIRRSGSGVVYCFASAGHRLPVFGVFVLHVFLDALLQATVSSTLLCLLIVDFRLRCWPLTICTW
jgi:hypothetical protein